MMLAQRKQISIINNGEHKYVSKLSFNIPTLLLDLEKDELNDMIPLLIHKELIKSKRDFYRLVKQGEIRVNDEKIAEDDVTRVLYNQDLLRIGKNKFVRINK